MANKGSDKASGYTTVTIYDQAYHLTGHDPEHIRQIAEYVDTKMRAVAAQGHTVDSLRVAVLAALNLADELSQALGGVAWVRCDRMRQERRVTVASWNSQSRRAIQCVDSRRRNTDVR